MWDLISSVIKAVLPQLINTGVQYGISQATRPDQPDQPPVAPAPPQPVSGPTSGTAMRPTAAAPPSSGFGTLPVAQRRGGFTIPANRPRPTGNI